MLTKRLLALFGACSIASLILDCNAAFSQRPRFPDFFQANPVPAQPVQFQSPSNSPPALGQGNGLPTIGTPTFNSPSIITSPPIITTTPPPTVLQQPSVIAQPSFDPFQTPSSPFPVFEGQAIPTTPQFGSPPQVTFPQGIQVNPPVVSTPQFPGQPNFQQGTVGALPYTTTGTNWWPSSEWPSQAWSSLRDNVLPRVLERPRIRYTYIPGNGGNELGINDMEVATTITFANFAGGRQPLRISPGFIWHYWSGPSTAATGAELPARAYSAYIAADFISDPCQSGGMEANIAVGMYSDFKNTNSDSWRITGTILGWQRLNSYSTAKLGIEYFDRVDVKILPAFGVYMTPNPDLKFDIYFPRPKLAQRLPSWGNYEAWGYIGAEYGGGSWTVELTGADEQVDINDVRAFFGAEWLGPRKVTGFLEIGYVFERKLVYRFTPSMSIDLKDSIMLRTGVAF